MVEFGSFQSPSVFLTSICALITACRCSDIKISVGLSHNVSRPGDNVTLTCRVQGATPETAVVWEKLPVTPGADAEREIIGRDDQLSEDYRKLTNYDIFVIELPNVVLSILTINNVGVEESGLIGCSISVEGAIYRDTTLFQVFKQPSDIWCSCDHCALNDSKISAIEGNSLEVVCIVRRVQPLPHISAHLGHKNLGGHHTMTNRTTVVHCGRQHPPDSGHGSTDSKHCPVHFDYDVQFRLTSHVVSYLDDGHALIIAVGLGHSGWPAKVKHLQVNVRYAPKFNCSSDLSDAEFRSRNLVISCLLCSNPVLSHGPIVWWRDLYQSNRTLHLGQTIDGYELRGKGSSYEDGETPFVEAGTQRKSEGVAYTVELVIHEKHSNDFQTSALDEQPWMTKDLTSFHFYAQNAIGSTTQTVRLRRQISTTPKSQPAKEPSGRSHGRHQMRQPSSRVMHPINGAALWTIHPLMCAVSMTSYLLICIV